MYSARQSASSRPRQGLSLASSADPTCSVVRRVGRQRHYAGVLLRILLARLLFWLLRRFLLSILFTGLFGAGFLRLPLVVLHGAGRAVVALRLVHLTCISRVAHARQPCQTPRLGREELVLLVARFQLQSPAVSLGCLHVVAHLELQAAQLTPGGGEVGRRCHSGPEAVTGAFHVARLVSVRAPHEGVAGFGAERLLLPGHL